MEQKARRKRSCMQMETNATDVATFVTLQHLSTEVKQIQMSLGPWFAPFCFSFRNDDFMYNGLLLNKQIILMLLYMCICVCDVYSITFYW